MTHFDDDRADMDILPGSPALSDADAEALLAGRALPGWDDVHGTVRVLRTAPPPPAPAPSAALLAMLDAGFEPIPLVGTGAARVPWRRWPARMAVAAAAVVATTLGGAAANALPAPLQNAVAAAVSALTPLDLPRAEAGRAVSVPASDGDESSGTLPGRDDPPANDVTMLDGQVPPDGASTAPGQANQPSTASAATAPGAPGAPAPAPASGAPAPAPTRGASAPAPAPTRDEGDESDSEDVDDRDGSDSRDADEPEDDAPELDEPDTDGPDSLDVDDEPEDAADPDEPDGDGPDSGDADAGDADEPDVDESRADD